MLEVKNISKSFKKRKILDSISLSIKKGEILGILGPNGVEHSYRIISYRGVGHLPKGMTGKIDVRKRILLDRLPKLLDGYGKSHQDFEAAVVGAWHRR